MQSASSRVWTRIAVSISYDDNHYTTGTSYKEVPYIPPNSRTGVSPLDGLVLYPVWPLSRDAAQDWTDFD